MKRQFCFIAIFVLLFSLPGCQFKNKDTDNVDKAVSGEAASGEGNGVFNPLYNQLGIPEEVVTVPVTEQGNHAYSVNARVSISDEAVPGIFREEKVLVDIDYINHMADILFDGGEYQQVKPLICYTFDELMTMKAQLLKALEDRDSETFYADKIRYTEVLSLLKGGRDSAAVSTYQEGSFTKVQMDDEDSVLCMYDEIYLLEGKVSGTVYQLAAYKEREQVNVRIVQMTEGYPELFPEGNIENGLSRLSSDSEEGASGSESIVAGESRQNYMPDSKSTRQSYEKTLEEGSLVYSKEEAGELACSFMKQFVTEDMEVSYTAFRTGAHADCYALRDLGEKPFHSTQGNPSIDGYTFVLQRRIKGLSCTNIETVRTLADNGETSVTEQEYYEVEVSNRGVVNVRFMNPIYQITETMKEAPELMKFSEIQTIMEDVLEEESRFLAEDPYYEDDVYLINQISLSYVTVQYDGNYTLLPVWQFLETVDGAGIGEPYLIISAVDGSILFRPEHGDE